MRRLCWRRRHVNHAFDVPSELLDAFESIARLARSRKLLGEDQLIDRNDERDKRKGAGDHSTRHPSDRVSVRKRDHIGGVEQEQKHKHSCRGENREDETIRVEQHPLDELVP